MLFDTPGPAPSRAAAASAVKRFKRYKTHKTNALKPAGKTILSLPRELQEEVLSHLLWYDHFAASMVCPEWATILQSPKFREKRYCIETWSETKSEESFEAIAEDMGFRRYHPDDAAAVDLNLGSGGLGMHGLLCTGTMILSVRENGEAKVYLVIRHLKEMWKGKDKGEYVGPMMGPYEEALPFDAGVRRCRWRKYKNKVDTSFHDITGSPLLGSDSQFYHGTETRKTIPKHIQAKIEKDCKEKYWANGSDTWDELNEREDDITVRVLNRDFVTDGIYSRARLRCDSDYMEETTIPTILPLPATSIDTGTSVQKILEYVKDAVFNEQELDGDGPLECWATFQEYCPQKRGECGPEDVEFHPRRKIFLTLWNLSKWSLNPKKEEVECTCDEDALLCTCQWESDVMSYFLNCD